MVTWSCLKMGVYPPNHPKLDHFSIETYVWFWGTPIPGNLHVECHISKTSGFFLGRPSPGISSGYSDHLWLVHPNSRFEIWVSQKNGVYHWYIIPQIHSSTAHWIAHFGGYASFSDAPISHRLANEPLGTPWLVVAFCVLPGWKQFTRTHYRNN